MHVSVVSLGRVVLEHRDGVGTLQSSESHQALHISSADLRIWLEGCLVVSMSTELLFVCWLNASSHISPCFCIIGS